METSWRLSVGSPTAKYIRHLGQNTLSLDVAPPIFKLFSVMLYPFQGFYRPFQGVVVGVCGFYVGHDLGRCDLRVYLGIALSSSPVSEL